MSDTYTVERSATIAAPVEAVYQHIVDFHRWSAWSPWDDLDPAMQKTYEGAESGTGARYSWVGNRKVGSGSMEITGTDEPSRIDIALEFLKPFKASNSTVFSLEPAAGGTKVTWAMTGRNTTMTKLMGIFKSMDSMVGPDFEKGLTKLKQVAEAG